MATEKMETSAQALGKKIWKLECELLHRYTSIGKGILELAESEAREVNRLVDEIIEMRQQLSEAKGELECSACMAHNVADSKFCNRCGAALFTKKNEKEKKHDNE
ncbi:zinc ribbon domain-containing protein [Christensenellaceae bacterium OttesenSCG-928-L17]|nr:zinc ribbon domain-containing protein [Christensenellaceae bacterium OttesenSCG-928-L17]